MPERPQPHPAIELKGISKHFGEGDTRVDALRGITLTVSSGELIGLLGPSGSGKSILLNVIGAIIEPNEGWMKLDGEVVYDNNWLRRDLRRLRLEKIGFIFQTHNLLPFLDATDNVAVVLQLAGLPREEGIEGIRPRFSPVAREIPCLAEQGISSQPSARSVDSVRRHPRFSTTAAQRRRLPVVFRPTVFKRLVARLEKGAGTDRNCQIVSAGPIPQPDVWVRPRHANLREGRQSRDGEPRHHL